MVTEFESRVYRLASRIPPGKVASYRQIAEKLNTRAYRAVGNALNKNPFSPKVPCHRVIRSDGSIGGFAKGTKAKERMLKDEGIEIKDGKISPRYLYKL